ncbi:Protein EARLY RESPONSIVE TO DEHYDRATION 15 [Dionaea muscipula]
MAMVSGRTSRLNPNAPLYIPAALRQVEDFSQEWWNLITTSVWYRDYWLSQQQEVDPFYGNNQANLVTGDIVDLLPDDIDLGVDEEVLNMETQYEEFILSSRENVILSNTGNDASRNVPVNQP